jgi:hypothetical protein
MPIDYHQSTGGEAEDLENRFHSLTDTPNKTQIFEGSPLRTVTAASPVDA